MKKNFIEEEGGKIIKFIQIQLEDDSDISEFDLQKRYTQSQVKMGDSLHIQIGENVMFVKEIVQKILDGPYKLLKQIRFELIGLKQEFILRFMSEHYFQICFINEIGEEIFQLIEEFINISGKDIKQLEFFYKYQIDTHYNQLIYNLAGENLKDLFHASFIFELQDVQRDWKLQVIKNIGSMEKVEMISTCWNTKLRQEDILSFLNACKLNKYLLIQAQNILFHFKEPSISNSTDKDEIEKQRIQESYISNKHLFLDISFFKPGLIEDCDVMQMKEFWKWIKERASNYISIKMKFATSAQINKIILPVLDAILKKNQSLCLDSEDLKLEYDLPTRNLSVHFKEDQQQAKAFKPEDWSFIYPFIIQYKLTTQKIHINMENISFRNNNRHIYSQILDFSKINHKISHFTIVAPISVIQQDIKLKNLWKQNLQSLQILVNYSIQASQNSSSAQNQQLKKGSLSSISNQQQQKQQISPHIVKALTAVDNKHSTAVKRFRKNQFDVILKNQEIIHQAYHLNQLLKQQETILQLIFKNQKKKKIEKDSLLNNFLDKGVREKILQQQWEKINSNSSQLKQMKKQPFQTKLFFLYEINSKLKNIQLKLNMRHKVPSFINELVTINCFSIVNELHFSLQSDTHDGQIDKILKFFSNSKNLKNLKIKLFCNHLSDLAPKLIKFIKTNIKELQTIETIVEGGFNGSLEKDCIKNITHLLPFQEQSKKLMSGIFKFEGINNLQNVGNMMEMFKYIEREQIIEIKTQTLDIIKDKDNNINIRVDCKNSTLMNVFDQFIIIHQTYQQFSIVTLDVVINELQFYSFFQFIQAFIGKIKSLKVLLLNIDLDSDKNDTYDKIRSLVYSYHQFDNIELRFRDQNSKEDSFSISYDHIQKDLNIYMQGNQIYSDDFNYDRLLSICANLKNLYETELKKFRLELIFDNNARFQRCKLDVFKIKTFIFKNLINLRKFFAVVKVMNQFSRTFETHRIFDEQIRAIQTKDKCISKYILLYKGFLNSQLRYNYRREIIWDSVSLMIFGQLHLNLKPLLSKRFLLNSAQEEQTMNIEKQNPIQVEDFGILSIFQQERESVSQRQFSTFNQNPPISMNESRQISNEVMNLEGQEHLEKKISTITQNAQDNITLNSNNTDLRDDNQIDIENKDQNL